MTLLQLLRAKEGQSFSADFVPFFYMHSTLVQAYRANPGFIITQVFPQGLARLSILSEATVALLSSCCPHPHFSSELLVFGIPELLPHSVIKKNGRGMA